MKALRLLHPRLLRIDADARGLAQAYLRKGILPPRFSDDALHVAVAVCHRMDVIVSWNMKHLANMCKRPAPEEGNSGVDCGSTGAGRRKRRSGGTGCP